METQTLPVRKFILSNGLLLGVSSIILSVIMYVMNMHLERNWIVGTLGFVLMIVFIVLGISQFKKSNGTFLSLSQALKIGVGIAVVAGVIGAIYQLIFMNVIEPDFMDKVMEKQYEQMVESNPNMTQEQLDMSMEMAKKFSSPAITAAFSLIASAFFGLIIALIAGLVMKKENSYA
jgi:predicted branched-subunit amino acid permease